MSELMFSKVGRSRLVDDVVAELQRLISSGGLQPGDKLPTEPELMAQLGVGRSTVREAVRVLVHAGLLDKRQGYGTYLQAHSAIREPLLDRLRRSEVADVFEARRLIEPGLARLAALRRDDDDLRRIRGHLETRQEALRAGDMAAFARSDIEFHLAIAVAGRNPVAADLYRSFTTVLLDAVGKLREIEDETNDIHHERLLEAIEERDGERAVYWTEQNLDRILELAQATGAMSADAQER